MDLLILHHALSFLSDRDSIDLINSYLELFVIARVVIKKDETPDDEPKV